MELVLYRSYFNEGTNGTLISDDKFLCHTIELPWKNNERNISCIPEGNYELIPRYSKRFHHHLLIKNVIGRSYILFHPANDAQKELRGCIAPVRYLSGIGKGLHSKDAMHFLLTKVYQAIDRKDLVRLIIKSN